MNSERGPLSPSGVIEPNDKDAGGMRLGANFRFVGEQDMPKLDSARIAEACDNVVSGRDCYSNLLYLSRARSRDIASIFAASRSASVQQRWQRLWVLCPVLAKLARLQDTRPTIVSEFTTDLAALHMFSKFNTKTNRSAQRFFERTREALLESILDILVSHREDRARAELLAGIVAVLETKRDVLWCFLVERYGESTAAEAMGMLHVADDDGRAKGGLSSEEIKNRLTALSGREFGL